MRLLIPLSGENGWNGDLTKKGRGRRERKELSLLSCSNMGAGYHGEHNLHDASKKLLKAFLCTTQLLETFQTLQLCMLSYPA